MAIKRVYSASYPKGTPAKNRFSILDNKIKELNYFYNKQDIRKVLIELAEVDLKSKTTDINPISLIENFILKINT